jgi:hypothetical protein
VTDNATLRAGIFNVFDEDYTWWSDVRGLPLSSTNVSDAYTRGGNASDRLPVLILPDHLGRASSGLRGLFLRGSPTWDGGGADISCSREHLGATECCAGA